MPELPDLESFKIYVKGTSLHKRITAIECRDARALRGVGVKALKKKLIGRSFRGAFRRGKFLILEVGEIPEKLIFHFGMTGDLHYVRQGREEIGQDRFTRLLFKFANGFELRWMNMRKLGKVYLVKELQEIPLMREMGPEPLTLSPQAFLRLLHQRRAQQLKAFFLDQRAIAGIGNVYADEILFRAGLAPHRKVQTLSSAERVQLYGEMLDVLREAIRVRPPRGMLFGAWWLIPHRDKKGEGRRCPRNRRHRLKRETIAGRTAVYCPICQPHVG